ncbi:MAG: prolyl oligopeptidase family serine peptidase [Planctomycetaceae bacterium]|nr:prolyl oligopeptidase family serine peptidase [Planctomycetaceae bacterium]
MGKAANQSIRLTVGLLFVFLSLHQGVFAAKVQRIITYESSISTDANGPLHLTAELNYDSMRPNSPIAVVMHGYSPSTTFGEFRPAAQRLRDKGFFTIMVAMRGRDGSDGIRDSGGVEIYDIYDAVETVKKSCAQYLNPNIVYITGYSGGGGNTMSALTKFPDYFRAGAAFFGMSDYGYDPVHGWYFEGAAPSHQAQMAADIGNPVTGGPLVRDRYMARASNLASMNNPYSEIHLFVNYNEPTCPSINDTSYRDNALTAASFAGEFSNITVHIGGYGQYQDFDGDGLNDPEELQNWPHGLPTAEQQNAAEAWFLDRLLAGQIPQPVMNPQDTLFVAGYVKTKPFSLWLGNGQNAAGSLNYELSNSSKVFRLEILSSDRSITGVLKVNVADMNGQTINVLLNGNPIDQFTAASLYQYNGLADGDTLTLTCGAIQHSADINNDSEVDLRDFGLMAEQWQENGPGQLGDLNGDGAVDLDDLLSFTDRWFVGKPIEIYSTLLDSDPNWSRQGQWQFGIPQGQGGTLHGYPDPACGFTGGSVFGVNLQGDYSLKVSGPYWLTLGPIDCTGYKNISLSFARWLNTDEPYYMDCRIEISNDNVNWTTVWKHEAVSYLTDDHWTMVEYGLGAAAQNQQTVYIRWGYGVCNARVWPFSGWNIDDIVITGKRL